MKQLLLASFLGAALGVHAIPGLPDPVHFQVTRAHSLHGTVPATAGAGSVTLGTVALDFVLTDVVLGSMSVNGGVVTVNGTPVLTCPVATFSRSSSSGTLNAYSHSDSLHLSAGVYVPAGSTLGFRWDYASGTTPVTLCGRLQ
jgi:hypothetical protein